MNLNLNSNNPKKNLLTHYNLIIKEFIVGFFKEIKFVLANPATSMKKYYYSFRNNLKYIFIFKNYSVSLILVSLGPRIAVYLGNNASDCLTKSYEYPLFIYLFYFLAFITYFLFVLGLYQSILLVSFSFKKGTNLQKIVSLFFLFNSLSYVFAIINQLIDFNFYISKYIL